MYINILAKLKYVYRAMRHPRQYSSVSFSICLPHFRHLGGFIRTGFTLQPGQINSGKGAGLSQIGHLAGNTRSRHLLHVISAFFQYSVFMFIDAFPSPGIRFLITLYKYRFAYSLGKRCIPTVLPCIIDHLLQSF